METKEYFGGYVDLPSVTDVMRRIVFGYKAFRVACLVDEIELTRKDQYSEIRNFMRFVYKNAFYTANKILFNLYLTNNEDSLDSICRKTIESQDSKDFQSFVDSEASYIIKKNEHNSASCGNVNTLYTRAYNYIRQIEKDYNSAIYPEDIESFAKEDDILAFLNGIGGGGPNAEQTEHKD